MTQNFKSVITVGGSIASSFPSSMKKAREELGKLQYAQKQDEAEARKLDRALKSLGKGTDEYKQTAAQAALIQRRLNFREDDILKAGLASRKAEKGVSGLAGGLKNLAGGVGPAGLALGGLVGTLGILTAALTGAGKEAQNLLNTSITTGTSTEDIQRLGASLNYYTGNLDQANREAAQFAKTQERLRRDVASGVINTDLLKGLGPDFQKFLDAELPDAVDLLVQRRIQLDLQGGLGLELFDKSLTMFGGTVESLVRASSQDTEALERARVAQENATIVSEDELRSRLDGKEAIEQLTDEIKILVREISEYLVPVLRGFVSGVEQVFDVKLSPGVRENPVEEGFAFEAQRALRLFFGGFGVIGSRIAGRQHGGQVRPGEITLVGEDGPELARFPGGTNIIPMQGNQGNGGRTVYYITMYNTINNPQAGFDVEGSFAQAASNAVVDVVAA